MTYQFRYVYTNEIDFPAWYIYDVAITIGHELMHQWTGNLITCEWWDDIWINEAFAEFGGYLSLRWAEPDVVWENQVWTLQLVSSLRLQPTHAKASWSFDLRLRYDTQYIIYFIWIHNSSRSPEKLSFGYQLH